jgi:hypothetical protein
MKEKKVDDVNARFAQAEAATADIRNGAKRPGGMSVPMDRAFSGHEKGRNPSEEIPQALAQIVTETEKWMEEVQQKCSS